MSAPTTTVCDCGRYVVWHGDVPRCPEHGAATTTKDVTLTTKTRGDDGQ